MLTGTGERPAWRASAGFTRATLSPGSVSLRIGAASALIALLGVVAWRPVHRPAPDAPLAALMLEPASRPAIPDAPAPPPVAAARFDLLESGIDPVRVTARFDPRTGLREDVLSRGDIAVMEAPALRLTLTRNREAGGTPSLFVLMARRAAAGPAFDQPALAVVRTGSHGRIQTKFGPVDTLEVTFGSPAPRTCLGFVTREAGVRLDGWACAPLGHPLPPQALACTLDALSLVDLADPETTAAFSAEASPRSCSPTKIAEASNRFGRTVQRGRNKK